MTRVRGSKSREERKTVIGDREFQQLLDKASEIKQDFFRLRSLCLLSILRLCGKRRGELATLEVDSCKVENDYLNITFTLEKKRKGTTLAKQSTKAISLIDPLAKNILNYLEYLKNFDPKPKYVFSRAETVFGKFIGPSVDKHVSGRQVFNLVRDLTKEIWPHLFRETVGSDVIKSDPSLFGVFKVQRRLDLEDFRTGFRYLRRYATDIIEREQKMEAVDKIS